MQLLLHHEKCDYWSTANPFKTNPITTPGLIDSNTTTGVASGKVKSTGLHNTTCRFKLKLKLLTHCLIHAKFLRYIIELLTVNGFHNDNYTDSTTNIDTNTITWHVNGFFKYTS